MKTSRKTAQATGLLAGLSAALLISGCATVNLAQVHYDVALAQVERAPAAAKPVVTEKPSRYTDGLIEANFAFSASTIDVKIANKSGEPLAVVWDDSSFIDRQGAPAKIVHPQEKRAEPGASTPPTVIAPGGAIHDVVMPTSAIAGNGGYASQPGANPAYGKNLSMLPFQRYNGVLSGEAVRTSAEEAQNIFFNETQGAIGARMGLVLTLASPDSKYRYTFWFEVRDATIGQTR